MDREVFVDIDLHGRSVPVGRLWWRIRKGRESASFEYDPAWIGHDGRFALEPALALAPGPFHTPPGKALFGAIGDSSPDRWGRVLMRRAERRRAERDGRAPRTLFEIDLLLQVDDEARQGALRFRAAPGGPHLAAGAGARVPPLVALPGLLSAAGRVADGGGGDGDMAVLLAPGSSLGGARPKASIRDRDGHLALAKFPHPKDDINVVLWEGVALSLARRAGIPVPEWRIVEAAGRQVIVIRRFDRIGGERVPFLSAMSMLGANDNEMRSYLEIADALREHGASARADLAQLWRRVVFGVLVSNTDDHLRNHGFLHAGRGGWRLSPAYDLNPVPVDVRPRVLSTAIDVDDPTASVDLALETAGYYGLEGRAAEAVVREVGRAVAAWREEAMRLGAAPHEISRMASAFEHADLQRALHLR